MIDSDLAAAKATYARLRGAQLSAVRASLVDHVRRLDWSADEIDRYRTEKLRGLVRFARERSAFYGDRLRDVDPATATVADLAQIPPLTKQEAQEQWDRIITRPGLTRADAERILAEQPWFSYTSSGEQVFSSGGSSGVRGVYVWDWDHFVTLACLAWRWQVRGDDAVALGRPAHLAVIEAGEPPHASTPLFDVPTGPGMRATVVPAGGPFEQIVRAVRELRPTHLVGYASVIGRLARATLDGALDIRPVRVSTNSEPLTAEDRSAITSAWGAPIHNLWGSTEIGVQAVGCGMSDALHICADEVILERVDDDGHPVGPGEPATRTLATGLAGRTFPFIRYDLGDEVELLAEPCACGSAMPRVASVDGRRDDDFRYATVLVPAAAFRYVLGTDARISEYQVRQTVRGAEVLVVGSPVTDEVCAALIRSLAECGLPEAQLDVRIVEAIPRHATTGKLKRFVALPG